MTKNKKKHDKIVFFGPKFNLPPPFPLLRLFLFEKISYSFAFIRRTLPTPSSPTYHFFTFSKKNLKRNYVVTFERF